MGALTDFFQSASNAVASNVSAPVDGISWLMRKAGFDPGPAPVGGSDWMRNHGLTADVDPGAASVLGETAGMLAPFAAAAKAPQIARTLLQGADNLAAPAALNKQAGAVVWHGSPHQFDAFDASKIGTGEGAQAYGHGLYVADSPTVAQSYIPPNEAGKAAIANQLAAETKKAARYSNEGAQEVFEMFNKGNTPQAIRSNIDNIISSENVHPAYAKKMNQAYDKGRGIYQQNQGGSLYKVDLPDEHIAKMLDWDKPLSQQPHVLDALSQDYSPKWVSQFADKPGSDLYKSMSGGLGVEDLRASGAAELQKAGIPGIRYLDGGSRGAGAGSSNYVIFPGNEGALTIMERNGLPPAK